MRTNTLDKKALLEKLKEIRYEKDEGQEDDVLDKMDFAASLLPLLDITHPREYELCAQLAAHLLGEVPEPDNIDLEAD